MMHIKESLKHWTDFMGHVVIDSGSDALQAGKVFAGVERLDQEIVGFKLGELVIIGGRLGTGVDSLATKMAIQVSLVQRKTVLFFSLEKPLALQVACMHSTITKIDAHNIIRSYLTELEWGQLTDSVFALY